MILVTGASGALGGLVLHRLAAGGAPVVGGTRAPGNSSARQVDFDRPETLRSAFAGVDVLVLVSAGFAEDDVVLARHGAAVDAAASAGVRHVVYTSLAGSGERLSIALAHRWTEARLGGAPFHVTVLRNGLYAELLAGIVLAGAEQAAATGVFAAPWGAGRLAVVAREDLADVAARVAAQSDADLAGGARSRHAGRTYELEGVTAVSGADVAAILSAGVGRPVRYQPVSLADVRAALSAGGAEPYQVAHTISMFANLGAGLLDRRDSDLPALLDIEPRPVRDLLAEAVAALTAAPGSGARG
ncbi:SDR family oxidoreductase [Pseudonocardia aurantiaca]|uniref:NmrA family NAD(P)-binding protein n=1 Tax=Pseudonocardia aurantiaca TaxID=75290 RepID=A0ABW4FXP1_9PSEU